jgi:hypothetical protein
VSDLSVVDATLVELEKLGVGVVDGPEGQVALALARSIDAARNGMATQGDSRTLLEVLNVLREAHREETDSVDDARARRETILRAV